MEPQGQSIKIRPSFFPYGVLLGITFALLLGIASFLPLLSYQEARRAVIIQETFLSHSAIPKYNGEPYFTKPPLHTWLSIPFYALGNIINQETFFLRLPSFLSYFLVIYLLYLISQKDILKTLLSTFILFSSFRFLSFTYRIDLEPLFVSLSLAYVYFILKFQESPKEKYVFLSYFFFGLAFLVRGPLHFFLIPSLIFYVFLFKNKRLLRLLFHPLGWLLLLSLIFPFYVYGYFKFGPKVFQEFLQTDLSERLVAKKDPFYYYIKAFLLNFLPYLLLLLFKIKELKKIYSQLLKDHPLNFFLTLSLLPLLFLSFTGQKFDKYLLFLYPLFSLFLSEVLLRLYKEDLLLKISALFFGICYLVVILPLLANLKTLKLEISLWEKNLHPQKKYLFYEKIHPLALFILKNPIPVIKDFRELQNFGKGEKILICPDLIKDKRPYLILKDPYKRAEFWYLYQIE